jgi:uncharacterized protein YbjT (DUF2867 family)
MKVLVVGATGFVGSQVAQALCARGHQTGVLVRGGRAHPRGSQFEGRVDVVDGDLTRPETLASACAGIEAVVCTATSMPQCHENGLLRVDHDGVASLIQAAEKAGAKKFVYTSYSGNIRYDSPLETAKRSCESLLLNSAMWAVILRPSYFMEMWLSPALGFDPLHSVARIYGSGMEKISYVSAHDVANFAVAAVEKEISVDQVVEIGGPDSLSQLEAVSIFETALRTKFKLESVSIEALEMQHGSEDAMQKTFAALMLSYAKGDTVAEATANSEKYGVHLHSVAEYASRFVGQSSKSA